MSDYLFSFEKLRVWSFGLTSQLNRAAVSVGANLAQGSGRTSAKDQGHFSQFAYGSLMESARLLIPAGDQESIKEIQLNEQRDIIAGLSNQINPLRNAQFPRASGA